VCLVRRFDGRVLISLTLRRDSNVVKKCLVRRTMRFFPRWRILQNARPKVRLAGDQTRRDAKWKSRRGNARMKACEFACCFSAG
jgi:hypothetical protein